MTHDQLIDDVLEREGGFVNDPADRGGATKFGITAHVYLAWLVRNMTEDQAREIYRQEYLVGPGINDLPEAVRPLVFDCAVNHGVRRAVVWLQEAAMVGQDGIIGPITLRYSAFAPTAKIVNKIVERRIKFYKAIVAGDPSQNRFLDGWLARAESFRVT